MRKMIIVIFFGCLSLCLLLTCIVEVREIGSDIYNFYKSEKKSFSIESVDRLFNTIESTVSDNFILHSECIDIYGLIQRVQGKETIIDADESKTVTKGSDGKLYFVSNVLSEKDENDSDSKERINANIEKIKDFDLFCKERNVNLIYVNAPSKYDSSSVSFSFGTLNDDFEKSDYWEKSLSELNICNINLMKELKNEYDVYSDGFFITDHHWNIRTAFWGFGKLCEKINEISEGSVKGNLYNIDSYNIKTFKNVFLGSMGARTGRFFAGNDDIDVISPCFETNFRIQYKTKGLSKETVVEGPFYESIHGDSPTYYYITSDNSRIDVDNLLNKNGHRVLFIKDSFGVPVSGWMASCVDKMTIIDLRYKQEKSISDLLSENDYDMVIILYNAEMLGNSSLFNFTKLSNGY